MKDIINKARQSKEFPDSDWLKSVGFTMSEAKHAHVATITIGSFDGTFDDAKVTLRLQHFEKHFPGEWVTDVESYDELGRLQATVGLVESWVTTRAELVRLCIALGVESWKKALA